MPYVTARPDLAFTLYAVACAWAALAPPSLGYGAEPHPCQDNLQGGALQNYNQLEREGVAAFKAQRYGDAIASFETALALCDQSQSLLFALGRAHHLSGDCAKASQYYLDALQRTGKKLDDIRSRLSEAEQECADRPGTLEVLCAQPGVSLSIDGAPPVPCPHTAQARPGRVQVDATREGAVSYTAHVTVEANQATTVAVPALASDGPSPMAVAGWSAGGYGVAALISAVVLYDAAAELRAQVTDAKAASQQSGQPVSSLTRARALEKQADADTFATAGAICLGVGGVALTTGVLLLIFDSASDAPDDEPLSGGLRLSPWLSGQGDGGVSVTGRF